MGMHSSSQIDPRERAVVVALREIRMKRGISTAALSAKVKINRSTISMVELNACRPTLGTLLKICDGLGVNLSEMLEAVGA